MKSTPTFLVKVTTSRALDCSCERWSSKDFLGFDITLCVAHLILLVLKDEDKDVQNTELKDQRNKYGDEKRKS